MRTTRQSTNWFDEPMDSALDLALRGWGSIPWRERVLDVEPREDSQLARLLFGLVGIESDAFYMQTKLRAAGLLRHRQLREFNSFWVAEEADHSRALAALYQRFKAASDPPASIAHGTLSRDRRSVVALPALLAVSRFRSGMLAAYFVQGAFTEYVAVTIYRGLATMIGDRAAFDILDGMARQEGRHLRFYRTGAEVMLARGRSIELFVRHVADHVWRPPGVDLFGREQWIQMFGPVINDAAINARLRRMDTFFSSLPGLAGLDVAEQFLDRAAPRTPAVDNSSERPYN